MVYRKEHAIEAWKTFVSTGTILEDKVRPEKLAHGFDAAPPA